MPTVHVDPGPHRVEYGHDITLVCNLTYSPFFYNASWTQVQTGLITEYRTNVSQILFKISDATYEDSGQYTCNAASQYGSRQSQPVNISVYGGMIFQRIGTRKYQEFSWHMLVITFFYNEFVEITYNITLVSDFGKQ